MLLDSNAGTEVTEDGNAFSVDATVASLRLLAVKSIEAGDA
jgi:hypothetical protein